MDDFEFRFSALLSHLRFSFPLGEMIELPERSTDLSEVFFFAFITAHSCVTTIETTHPADEPDDEGRESGKHEQQQREGRQQASRGTHLLCSAIKDAVAGEDEAHERAIGGEHADDGDDTFGAEYRSKQGA